MDTKTNPQFPPPNPKKRPRPLLEEPILLEDVVAPRSVEPLFLIVKLNNGKSFRTVSPFAQKRGLLLLAGDVKSSKCLRDGSLLVEVANSEQSLKLQTATSFDTMSITVTAHKSLNTSKGVIFSFDLLDLSAEELKKELASQGVTDAYRIMSKKTGDLQPTPLLILTFGTPKLPDCIFAGYLRLPVRPHIPNPLRCFTCQMYGHSSLDCKRKPICGRCAKEDHETDACNNSFHCANCSAAHPVWSRDCPQWKLERRVMELKTIDNISLFEARKRIQTQNGLGQKSFARAVDSGAAVSAETARLQTMLEKQLQLSAEQAKRHEEMEERHRPEIEAMKRDLDAKNKEIESLKQKLTELQESRTLQLHPTKGRQTEPSTSKKAREIITYNPNTPGSSTSTSLSTRKDGMEIDPTDTLPHTWQTVKGKEKEKAKEKGKS